MAKERLSVVSVLLKLIRTTLRRSVGQPRLGSGNLKNHLDSSSNHYWIQRF